MAQWPRANANSTKEKLISFIETFFVSVNMIFLQFTKVCSFYRNMRSSCIKVQIKNELFITIIYYDQIRKAIFCIKFRYTLLTQT